ncbi:MAG TPA: twin-arginine translocation signal domain-containing protein, partial [Gemmatimonadales bacterium]|nr:twin-arginine translocation signal domain-containing protein [Gemmatimonadales bacterium]
MATGWSRRDFLAATAASSAALFAACRRGPAAPPAGSAELGPIEPRLNIYNWSDYIAPEVVPGFERE